MNKFTFATLAATIIAGSSAIAGLQDFVLFNNTASDVMSVYTSPTGVDSWEEDVLGDNILASERRLNIVINGRTERFWDIKIEYFGNKPDAEFSGIDLATVKELMLIDNLCGGTTLIPVSVKTAPAAPAAPAVRPVAAPMPCPWENPVNMPYIPLPTPSLDVGGGCGGQPYRICPSCHGTGNCPVCHGVGSTSNYGVRVPCDTKCSACGGVGRY